ncbi:DUF2961 domain-containing protein [Pedobacter chinensis]|uniref:DUF2961 domain-containing protein n=1 Tax=Pedobacter chinensis TaxID=2282421 RepID=A0A369PU02_9SPHI|nr:glycoside hydrolase family 172 protein [Pedobacter chinensis]RDC54199.1 DUF2961 domain-containing protein [Pedobacter chinensis]
MLKILKLITFMVIAPFCGTVSAQQVVSLSSLLKEMTDTRAVTYWPEHSFTTKQVSSYDRKSVSPDQPGWYSNSDFSQYIRTEEKSGRSENVMLDVNGPGVIVRFWLTTFKRAGTLRIYLDHQDSATIKIPSYDLLKGELALGPALLNPHSSYQKEEKGGSTLYLPIPYASHCKITWEESEQEKQPRYYQINYRSYTPETRVITFDREQLNMERELINQTEKRLWNEQTDKRGTGNYLKQKLPAGKTASLTLRSGSSAIDLMQIKVMAQDPSQQEQALRSTIIRISFDGKETVWCPVGDFSGSGVGGKPLKSWYRTVNAGGEIISRWIMPYKKSARISLENISDVPVDIELTTFTDHYDWKPSSLYFHTSWRQNRREPIFKFDAPDAAELNFITIFGKGIYMGNSLSVFNHMHTWYGEGDQKIWVDGDKFPSEYGTGTEDYYNTSWAPVVLYQTPFANAPRADHEDSFGYNTFTRTRNLDRIPFHDFFKMDMEMLGWQQGEADFAVTTYWYGAMGATNNIKDMKAEAKASLPK